MATKWYGLQMLCPIKQGALAEGKAVGVEKKVHSGGPFDGLHTTHTIAGKIVEVKETKTKIYVVAKFKDKKTKRRISKKKFLRMLINSVDFSKNNLEKLLTKMLYLNFTESDLKRILKHGGKFQRPRAFSNKVEGETLFLKVKDRYYNV